MLVQTASCPRLSRRHVVRQCISCCEFKYPAGSVHQPDNLGHTAADLAYLNVLCPHAFSNVCTHEALASTCKKGTATAFRIVPFSSDDNMATMTQGCSSTCCMYATLSRLET